MVIVWQGGGNHIKLNIEPGFQNLETTFTVDKFEQPLHEKGTGNQNKQFSTC